MLEFLQCTSRVLQYYINIDFMQVPDMQQSLLSSLNSGVLGHFIWYNLKY